jgi:hypothetical protein
MAASPLPLPYSFERRAEKQEQVSMIYENALSALWSYVAVKKGDSIVFEEADLPPAVHYWCWKRPHVCSSDDKFYSDNKKRQLTTLTLPDNKNGNDSK